MALDAKSLKLYVLGTLVTLTAFFGVIELATRTVSWARGDGFGLALHERDATDKAITDLYEFHPFTGFIFRPDSEFVGSHPRQAEVARVRTDEHGVLSTQSRLPLEKGADEIRIATIGASTTANINLTFEDNWPGRLAALVEAEMPDKRVTVINAGIPGFNTAQSVANLALRVMPFNPDVVIIYHAYNDLKVVRADFEIAHDYRNLHPRPYGRHDKPNVLLAALNNSMFYVRTRNRYRDLVKARADTRLVSGEGRLSAVSDRAARLFEHNLRMLIGSARAGGAAVVMSSFATLHEPNIARLEEPLSELQQRELISLLHFTPGLDLEGIFSGIVRYNGILERLADETGAGWVDNARAVPHADEYFVDRVHFSSAGAERMAANFLPSVIRALEMRASSPAQ